MEKFDTPLVFTPGWRWGETILPGEKITMEHVYGFYGTTYPELYRIKLRGDVLFQAFSARLSDVFAKDPYLQMGGDATRVSNSKLHIRINKPLYKRIQEWIINGKRIEMDKDYWLISSGVMMQKLSNLPNQGLTKYKSYDVIKDYIKSHKNIKSVQTEDVIYRHSRTAG